jgi:hypothetical protein
MFLDKYLNKKGFTALLVGGILAIMIGSVLIVISYTVISAIFNTSSASMGTTNSSLNASLFSNLSNITAALNITGISLIVELGKFPSLNWQKLFPSAELV